MDRETGWVILIALLCCLAVVLAAATLPSMMESGGGGDGGTVGSGDRGAREPADRDGANSGPERDVQYDFPQPCVGILDSMWGLLGLVSGTVGIAALATRSYDHTVTFTLSIALLPLALLVFATLTGGCGTQVIEPPASASELSPLEAGNETGGPFGGGDGTVTGPTLPALLVLTVLLVTVVAAFTALFYTDRDGDGRASTDPTAATDDAGQRAALGRAAGSAADRIESGDDFENEIYRAWREMTTPIDIDRPDSSTPGEFAAAARDAGLEPSHVEELRTMFEDVRYGDRPATADREDRAIEILRRIETAYGDDADRGRSNGDGRR